MEGLERKEWIFACNMSRFLVVEAIKDFKMLDWWTDKNVNKGDYIYLYLSAPFSKIAFKTEVINDDVPDGQLIDDKKYSLMELERTRKGKYIRIKLVLDLFSVSDMLSYTELCANGLNGPIQGPLLLNNNHDLQKYIKVVEEQAAPHEKPPKEIEEINKLDNLVSLVIKGTEKDAIIKARIGQGEFKKRLCSAGHHCKICGLNIGELLIASHIKPWSKCSDEERLDINNGFLLCPIHDALFDKGYIGFSQNGTIIISSSIRPEHYPLLSIDIDFSLPEISVKTAAYLKWHRKNVFKK